MPRYCIALTRNASEDAAIILDAPDEYSARILALASPALVWSPSDSASTAEIYEITEVDADEPLGVQDRDGDDRARLINALHTALDAEEGNWLKDPAGEPEWMVAARELLDEITGANEEKADG